VSELHTFFAGIFPLDPLEVFGIKLHAFGFLVGAAIIVGTIIAGKRAKKFGLSENVISQLALWAVIPGFIGAHFVHVLAYYPEEFIKRPLYLLEIWSGISSLGGFVGGALGVWYYFRRNKGLPFLPYADSLIYGFAFAWILGRLACTVAFDHPGHLTEFFMGMDYPGNGGKVGPGIRHNLGFYEALWAVAMSAFFFLHRNKTHFKGWFVATFVIAYVPFRFFADFLREVDERYGGLTPGQWISLGLLGLCVYLAIVGTKRKDMLVPDGVPKLSCLPKAERERLEGKTTGKKKA